MAAGALIHDRRSGPREGVQHHCRLDPRSKYRGRRQKGALPQLPIQGSLCGPSDVARVLHLSSLHRHDPTDRNPSNICLSMTDKYIFTANMATRCIALESRYQPSWILAASRMLSTAAPISKHICAHPNPHAPPPGQGSFLGGLRSPPGPGCPLPFPRPYQHPVPLNSRPQSSMPRVRET